MRFKKKTYSSSQLFFISCSSLRAQHEVARCSHPSCVAITAPRRTEKYCTVHAAISPFASNNLAPNAFWPEKNFSAMFFFSRLHVLKNARISRSAVPPLSPSAQHCNVLALQYLKRRHPGSRARGRGPVAAPPGGPNYLKIPLNAALTHWDFLFCHRVGAPFLPLFLSLSSGPSLAPFLCYFIRYRQTNTQTQ